MLKLNLVQNYRYYCDHSASNTFLTNSQDPLIHTPPPSLLKIYDIRKENSKDWTVLDSGATIHFLVIDTTATTVTPADNYSTVTIPDGISFKSTHVRKLDLLHLTVAARLSHVIPGLASQSLMSAVQLTDAGYGVNFLKHCITVTYNSRVVLEGARDFTN